MQNMHTCTHAYTTYMHACLCYVLARSGNRNKSRYSSCPLEWQRAAILVLCGNIYSISFGTYMSSMLSVFREFSVTLDLAQ